jgi:hypothetical protein
MKSRTAVILVGIIAAVAAAGAQSVLSPAQQKVINAKTAKWNAEQMKVHNEKTDARKLADFFCAPLALAELKKADKTANKVVLGADENGESPLAAVGNTKVSGLGTARFYGTWKTFAFECTLDATKATATSFTYKMK